MHTFGPQHSIIKLLFIHPKSSTARDIEPVKLFAMDIMHFCSLIYYYEAIEFVVPLKQNDKNKNIILLMQLQNEHSS